MECSSLREKLSAFVDEQLAPEEKKAVQDHLDACPECVRHLEDLRKTITFVRELEGVEPPSWFAREVMSKVREEAGPSRGILRKLFYPLHIKIPLEAAAAVAIVVTAFYVYRAVLPDATFQKPAPVTGLSAPAERDDMAAGQKEETGESLAVPPAVREERLRKADRESETARRTSADSYQTPVSRERAGKQRRKVFAGKSEEAEEQGILPDEKKAPEAAFRALDMDVKGETEGAVPGSPDAFIKVKQEEHAFTLFTDDIQSSLKTLEAAVEKLGGVIFQDELPVDRIIIAEMDAGKISLLRESLQGLGSIEEEKTAEGLQGKIRVKIEVLQAHEKE